MLAGDHVYKMDYGPMIAFHVEKDADITVGVVQVPVDKAHEFGVMTVDDNQRIIRFTEKPAKTGADARAAATSRWPRWASTSSAASS